MSSRIPLSGGRAERRTRPAGNFAGRHRPGHASDLTPSLEQRQGWDAANAKARSQFLLKNTNPKQQTALDPRDPPKIKNPRLSRGSSELEN